MEQWHEAEILADSDGRGSWFRVDHEHYESADDCDLTLLLNRAGNEVWDYIYSHEPGFYAIRVYANELVLRPAAQTVIDLDNLR